MIGLGRFSARNLGFSSDLVVLMKALSTKLGFGGSFGYLNNTTSDEHLFILTVHFDKYNSHLTVIFVLILITYVHYKCADEFVGSHWRAHHQGDSETVDEQAVHQRGHVLPKPGWLESS